MSFGIPPNGPFNGIGLNPSFPMGNPPMSALLPTPPTMQMPVSMTGIPPPLLPGMIPVAVMGSSAPVPFIITSAAPPVPGMAMTLSCQSPTINNTKMNYKKVQPSNQQEPGSTTTVFVGNITEHASDSLVRQILMKCGSVNSWKRVQGASGRLQAFGFCEYSSPAAALRSMRLLNGFTIGDKTLLVKVDSKTRAQLDDYKRKIQDERKDDDSNDAEYDVESNEDTKNEDDDCLDDIKCLINGNSAVLAGTYDESLPYMKRSHSGCADNLEGLDMDNAKKDLVSKEIRSFRQAYRNEDDASKKDKDRDRDREKERDRRKERDERDREKELERRRDSRRRRDDENGSDEEKKPARKVARETEVSERTRRSRSRSRDREKNKEDEEDEEFERRRLERIKREKDKSYMERLKEFEARERKKMREYEKQFSKDIKRKDEEAEERIHLKEFLEDYDDDRDDSKYYRGSAMSRRMRDREMEAESDHRDKQRESEEIDEILRKRLADPSPGNLPFVEKENEPPVPTRINREPTPEKVQPVLMKPTFSVVKADQRSPSPEVQPPSNYTFERDSPVIMKREREEVEDEQDQPSKKTSFGFGLKATNVSQPSNKKLESVFNSKEKEQEDEDTPKKKLSKIETKEEEDKKKAACADEKKETIRNLIEKIPTAKDELFQFPIKMEMIDQNLVDKRIKPWVNKKIFEYIGEQEPTLVEFICSKVTSKSLPKNILEDVEMVLDEEAEVFVVKMWRLLIYETEAKHLGLVK